MTELPDATFRLLLSLITGVVAAAWLIHDLVLIARLRGADRRDPRVADQRFGYAMGIIIGAIGIVGTLRFNGVI
ncbi:MAG TPA: hypothetical protein VGD37_34695 [Kofleriaceae bacterium]